MIERCFCLLCLFFMVTSCGAKKIEVPEEIATWLPYLYNSLSSSCADKAGDNSDRLRDMQSRINLSVHTTQRVQVFRAMEELRENTQHVTSFITTVRINISRKIGGGFDKERLVKKPYEKKGLYEFMTDTKNEHNAGRLKEELDRYYEYLKAKNYLVFRRTPFTYTPPNESFASSYFADKPIIMVLMSLVEIESDILYNENQILKRFTPSELLSNRRFYAHVGDETNKVRAGEDYTARLYVSQFPTWEDIGTTQMRVNGVRIKINASGAGEVKFKATGKGKQKWTGEIRMKYLGKDTVFVVEREYEVLTE